MYIPKHFEVTDKNKVLSFLRKNAFGQLTSILDGKLFASHIPFLTSTDGSILLGHLAKSNPQWGSIENQEVLITFQGSHDYISPSWYSSPGVPTWSYQTVHVYGNCTVIHDLKELKNIVDELTSTYESQFYQPWIPQYDERMLRGIVGIKVQVTEIQCQFKLNQNCSEADRKEVINQLDAKGSVSLASAMKENEFNEE
ncbi:FMN-binding negative transcriptional regulator [Haliea sp. AH-315-K21]|uniref:Transcriptional regulator n=1 Tax=SAR86 cluster bacterium TaxID=2030880 RepID=A0A2A5CJW3_9GAMM|nr:FMN-binding negative transcriptional regulator [Haliea sp. AH-315-K21]MBN4075506.1 FMN-binding negative transcriptional regulator [Gammaproteobacteria bacterium AH-315-E17]PCJ41822.1 MAG: transcriptional regulator [SAR86 cluster bacterium]PCJ43801.1 MAG: transcriptional regulator [SAR86 cluster bacterium]